MNPGNLFAELKRRNVVRAAGLYLVGAWLLTQVTSTILPQRDAGIPGLRADVLFRNLHDDPRWDVLLRTVGLADDQLN